MAILSGALVWLVVGVSRNIKAENHAKLMTTATFLAREKMVDIEDELYDKGFGEFEKEQTGDFDDKGFARFTLEGHRRQGGAAVGRAAADGADQRAAGAADAAGRRRRDAGGCSRRRQLSGAGGSGVVVESADAPARARMSSQFGIIKDVLEQAIRRVTVKITLARGAHAAARSSSSPTTPTCAASIRRSRSAARGGRPAARAPPAGGTGGGGTGGSGGRPTDERPHATPARARGFTLIEVMVAVSILAIVTTLTWASFKQTFSTKSADRGAGRAAIARCGSALERMARELSMAYVSQNEDTSQPERRTRFVGKHHGDIDEVTFSYFGHQRLYHDANEADTALVSYYAARDRDDSRKTNLMRRETRRLSNLKIDEQPGEADIVCDDVVKLKLDYYDQRDKLWREEWLTTSLDGQPDRLPSKIRITLTVHDERGKEVPFQTEVRVAMTEPLNNQPKNLAVTGVGQPPAGTRRRRRARRRARPRRQRGRRRRHDYALVPRLM